MDITIVTTAPTDGEALDLLKLMGLPFAEAKIEQKPAEQKPPDQPPPGPQPAGQKPAGQTTPAQPPA
jgi:hypothetical protein